MAGLLQSGPRPASCPEGPLHFSECPSITESLSFPGSPTNLTSKSEGGESHPHRYTNLVKGSLRNLARPRKSPGRDPELESHPCACFSVSHMACGGMSAVFTRMEGRLCVNSSSIVLETQQSHSGKGSYMLSFNKKPT